MEDVIKLVNDPFIKRALQIGQQEGIEKGVQEGMQFGSLNILSKMIRNKQLNREQSEQY